MIFAALSILIAFILLTIASIEDMKTREVPDYLSYYLIAIAVFVRILWFLSSKNFDVLFWVPISFGVLTGFSYLMYKGGQWGGGDVKVLAGLSIIMSSFPGEKIPFFANFLFNSLIVGVFYGLAGLGIMAILSKKKLKLSIYKKAAILLAGIITVMLFYYLPIILAFLSAMIVLSLVSLAFVKDIEKFVLERYVPVEKLTEGDWLVNDVKLNGKVYVKKRNIGLTIEDLKKLNKVKSKIKKVKIKIGIPFVPAFWISLIVTLLFGNILLRMFGF